MNGLGIWMDELILMVLKDDLYSNDQMRFPMNVAETCHFPFTQILCRQMSPVSLVS